ncbi:MAG TPA: ABC transporter permease [Anaerolineae bacterium]
MITWALLLSVLQGTIASGTSILYATLGGIMSARVGINNMGIEGIMLMGAAMGYGGALRSGNPWIGLLWALAAGALLGLAYAVFVIALRANQVVTGLAFVGLGVGLSGYIGRAFVSHLLPLPFRPVAVPLLGDIPFLGPALFQHDPLVYLSYVLVPALWWFMFRSRPGLHLRAVGENPSAADSAGINVAGTRYFYVAVGGALAAAGGAYLSLAYSPLWVEQLTAGRGWIAIALVPFSSWNPLGALAGAYLFGGIDASVLRLQAIGAHVEPFLLNALPYLFTVVALIVSSILRGRVLGPAALGQVYDRETR